MVVNLGIYVKAVRGIFSAAYSLLSDCTIYPVINGSAIYLDDVKMEPKKLIDVPVAMDLLFIWMIFLPRYREETESIYTVIMV